MPTKPTIPMNEEQLNQLYEVIDDLNEAAASEFGGPRYEAAEELWRKAAMITLSLSKVPTPTTEQEWFTAASDGIKLYISQSTKSSS